MHTHTHIVTCKHTHKKISVLSNYNSVSSSPFSFVMIVKTKARNWLFLKFFPKKTNILQKLKNDTIWKHILLYILFMPQIAKKLSQTERLYKYKYGIWWMKERNMWHFLWKPTISQNSKFSWREMSISFTVKGLIWYLFFLILLATPLYPLLVKQTGHFSFNLLTT